MQKGHMRFEPNINLHITDDDGQIYKTPICEIKNLNSFRAVERAVAYENWRQLEEWKKDHNFTTEKSPKQNRGWDDVNNITVFQRSKEEANDYRYFPDPDLLPVKVDQQWLESVKANMPELPLPMKARFMADYGLNDYDASVLTNDRATAHYFDQAVKAGGTAKRVANFVTQFCLKIANERNCPVDKLGVNAQKLAQLAIMADDGTINASAAVTIFEQMTTDDASPKEIAKKCNLIQQSDTGELEKMVNEVIAANAKAIEEVKQGGKKAKKNRNFLVGQVMQKTKGQANPKIVGEILDKILNQ